MDRKFLEEYKNKEQEEAEKFNQRLSEGKISDSVSYTPYRLGKLKDPVFYAFQTQKELDAPRVIWPQIPLAGSLIITLRALRDEKLFRENHGFDIQDIPKLVDFAKETGKVQFILAYDPTEYEGLDFLDPIFIELKPPIYGHYLPQNLFSTEIEAKKFEAEFYQIARIRFEPYVKEVFEYYCGSDKPKKGYLETLCEDYLVLRALGKHDVAEEIMNLILDDPISAATILTAYHYSLFLPMLDGVARNVDLDSFTELATHLRKEDRVSFISKIKFPCEIGAFLMKKLTPYPKSFRAMEYLVDRYKQEDLYNVMEALNAAIRSKSPDLLTMKAADMGEILDNIWRDSKKIQQEIKEVDFGISLAFGVIGPVAGLLTAGVAGLLVGLGLTVAKTSIDFFGSIEEKVVKKLRPSYLVNIYNFKSQYSIK
jgi:hypothetical protein